MPQVRDEQLARLFEFAARETFEIRVLPHLHAAMGASFTILTPDPSSIGGAQPFAYLDTLDGCRYEEKASVVSKYEEAFRLAFETSTPLEEWAHDFAVEKEQP